MMRTCSWLRNGYCPIAILVCVLLTLSVSLPCAGDEQFVSYADGVHDTLGFDDGCGSYAEDSNLVYVLRNSPGCTSPKNVCGVSSTFCFPSTLLGTSDVQDSCQAHCLGSTQNLVINRQAESIWPAEGAEYKLLDGRKVLCSSVDRVGGRHDGLAPENKNVELNDFGLCKGPLLPDSLLRKSSGLAASGDENFQKIELSLHNGSSSPHVEIDPPLLDWGVNRLYVPSLAFLTVANTYNDSVLHVYEPFSTDSQYYAYDFEKFSLEPGEASSITVVFLPRCLGLSSAHLVLQTSFGGFLIHAKGIAVESPFMMQPLAGFDVSPDGRLTNILSLHNPFDDVLHVKEVTAWVSIFSESTSHSANVVCRADAFPQFSDESSSSLNDDKCFNMKSNKLARSLIGIKPHRQWEVRPHDTETILEMSVFPHMEGNVYGAICMQLQNSSQGTTDTVIIPLEAEVLGMVGNHALTGSVSVFFGCLVPCDHNRSILSLSLRNWAPYLLSVVKISEATDGIKLFEVRYVEGLILYPGTVTLVGLIRYASTIDPLDIPPDIPSVSSNCKLFVVTNDSASPQIEIPCQDLVNTCSRCQPGSGFVASQGSHIGLKFQHEKEKSANAGTGYVGSIIEEQSIMKSHVLEIVEADEFVLRNWRSQGTKIDMSVLEDHEVLFPVVQVGTHCSKWITVRNPSEKPVVMQLVLNSGVIVDHCKSADDFSEYLFLSTSAHINSMENTNGFSIPESAIIEALVHPFGRATFGPIVFRPSDRCMWRSSALIRNNLSGVEWLPLQGIGGSHSLVLLEGSKPVQKLEFNLPVSLNVSSSDLLIHLDITSSACSNLLSKELYAKNTGELPLEVIKLEVSGTDCGLDGFTIHTCKGFALAPGESTRLQISYQADFYAEIIHRDLKLTMATGILVIPMKASLPVYMLNLCRKLFLWMLLRKLCLLVFVVASIALLVFFGILPHVFSSGTEDCFMKSNTIIATISRVGKQSRLHRNPRIARLCMSMPSVSFSFLCRTFQFNNLGNLSRSVREDQKPEASVVSRYPDCPVGIQNSTKRIQDMQGLDHNKKAPLSSPSSTAKPVEVVNNCSISELPHTGYLPALTTREKGRRRKRRAAGAGTGLASKLEVSSSQSGNSTPSSSPSSPSASTPKQVWRISPDNPDNQFTGAAEDQIHEKEWISESSTEAPPEDVISIKCYDNCWLPYAPQQSSLPGKQTGRPVLLPSATFPGTCWRAPGVATPKFSASTSPIAPHARAPGSNLSKEKTVKRDEEVEHEDDFTYNIWGYHFPEHLMGRQKEFLSNRSDASEGDSQSFFARGPQSLMTMPSVRSVSPGPKLPPFDVKYLHQNG